MDLQYLKRLIKILKDSAIDEIEIEENKTRIKLVRTSTAQNITHVQSYQPQIPVQVQSDSQIESSQLISSSLQRDEEKLEDTVKKYHEINSPIVGMFYRAPAPDAESYVTVGQNVKQGMTLCIIEAMKLMNEIESDIDGKIIQILVENGKPVEYNQPLFLIDPS